jgi:hypothetical protein
MGLATAVAATTLIFCAPGYPGGAGDAQPLLDQFASAAVKNAGWPAGSLGALYDPTASGGVAKLGGAEAALAFVPYPFYYQYAAQLHLKPLVQADVADVGLEEHWTLVAKSGRSVTAATLAGYTILSVAGYAPDFVRKAALKDFPLPADVKIEATGQILSALRRVSAGEPVVALLDQTQATALPTLPFASQLQTVAHSAALPVALIALVDARLPAERAKSLQAGLLKMSQGGSSDASLAPLKLRGFVLPKLPPDSAGP